MLDVLVGVLIGGFAGFAWSWNKARLARGTVEVGGDAEPMLRRIATALIAAAVGGLIGAALGGMIGPR